MIFTGAPANLEGITNEAAFQTLVIGALRLMGWVVIALGDHRVGAVGIPDLLCFRGGQGEMIELKIVGKHLSHGQKHWQERWLPEGTTVHLMRNTTEDWIRIMELMS